MGKQKAKDVMPVNWRIDAVCAAAQKAGKGYARFVAEDLNADPDLYQKILDEYRAGSRESQTRCGRKSQGQR